jgi:hypothetical protein
VEKDVRFLLVDDDEGRVEFCQGGVWRVMCMAGFGPAAATVACKQLGHDPIGGKKTIFITLT